MNASLENIEQTAGSLAVLLPDGSSVRLGEAWADRPVVLALIRHFGCIFCKEQVVELAAIVPEIHAAGAELVIVGSGSPQMAGFFAEDYRVETPVLTDPQRHVYAALALKRPSGLALLDPRVLLRGFRATVLGGHRQERTNTERGDNAQLGGVFIVQPGGTVAWAHRSALAGARPAPATGLAALRRATGAAGAGGGPGATPAG